MWQPHKAGNSSWRPHERGHDSLGACDGTQALVNLATALVTGAHPEEVWNIVATIMWGTELLDLSKISNIGVWGGI